MDELEKILDDAHGMGEIKGKGLADDYKNLKKGMLKKARAVLNSEIAKAFRDGQLDCQKAGDPTNHKFWQEAVAKEIAAVLERLKEKRLSPLDAVFGKTDFYAIPVSVLEAELEKVKGR